MGREGQGDRKRGTKKERGREIKKRKKETEGKREREPLSVNERK